MALPGYHIKLKQKSKNRDEGFLDAGSSCDTERGMQGRDFPKQDFPVLYFTLTLLPSLGVDSSQSRHQLGTI